MREMNVVDEGLKGKSELDYNTNPVCETTSVDINNLENRESDRE